MIHGSVLEVQVKIGTKVGESMEILKRVYTDVSEQVFYNMIKRARFEDACVGLDGKVDIGKLLRVLVETYADGTYRIVRSKESMVKNEEGHIVAELNAKNVNS